MVPHRIPLFGSGDTPVKSNHQSTGSGTESPNQEKQKWSGHYRRHTTAIEQYRCEGIGTLGAAGSGYLIVGETLHAGTQHLQQLAFATTELQMRISMLGPSVRQNEGSHSQSHSHNRQLVSALVSFLSLALGMSSQVLF